MAHGEPDEADMTGDGDAPELSEKEDRWQRYREAARDPEYASRLEAALGEWTAEEEFHVGQLVRWRQWLRNRQYPDADTPAIVVGFPDSKPAERHDDAELEDDDILLGFLDGDREFHVFRFTSRRFTAWSE